jgi:hypothetical protein
MILVVDSYMLDQILFGWVSNVKKFYLVWKLKREGKQFSFPSLKGVKTPVQRPFLHTKVWKECQ